MADKDQVRQDENEEVKKEAEVTELDDANLEDVPGGASRDLGESELADNNGNCLC